MKVVCAHRQLTCRFSSFPDFSVILSRSPEYLTNKTLSDHGPWSDGLPSVGQRRALNLGPGLYCSVVPYCVQENFAYCVWDVTASCELRSSEKCLSVTE